MGWTVPSGSFDLSKCLPAISFRKGERDYGKAWHIFETPRQPGHDERRLEIELMSGTEPNCRLKTDYLQPRGSVKLLRVNVLNVSKRAFNEPVQDINAL